jgi:ParB family chromosome partitioning protein
MGHARALITIEDEAVQVAILKEIQESGLSVRDVETLVRKWQEDQQGDEETPQKPPRTPDPAPTEGSDRDRLQIQNFTGQLRARLSTQIQIKNKPNGDGGRIEIDYYSNEDLERLIELLLPD